MNRRSLLQALLGLPVIAKHLKVDPPEPEPPAFQGVSLTDISVLDTSQTYNEAPLYDPGSSFEWRNPQSFTRGGQQR